jgi:ubiquinone/menaquinone biosynthesis C-methylase UbiE
MTSDYVFDQTAHDAELERLSLLETVFDGATQRALTAAGVARGARCLEVGAGAGSIAACMSKVVGPAGHVAAVDISTRFLTHLAGGNVDVHEADIRSVGLERASFDVAHVRFVLLHQSDWRSALDAMLALLRPGGRVVVEEPDFSASRAFAGPSELCAAFAAVHRAIAAMFAARGMDHAFGARLPSIFQGCELEELAVENDAPVVRGGSAFARMMGMSARQLHTKYLATGLVTEQELERYADFSGDPACWAIYHGTVRATGRKPVGSRSLFAS